MQRIWARTIAESESNYTLFSPNEIAYVFVGSAISRTLIRDAKIRPQDIRSDRLYLRTVKGAFFTAYYGSLVKFLEHVNPDLMVRIHESIVVNIQCIRKLDMRQRLVGVATADRLEWLSASRNYFKDLREKLGFPKRRRRRDKDRF